MSQVKVTTILFFFVFANSAMLQACSSTNGTLTGSAVQDYDLDFDMVTIHRQENGGQPIAMIVSYVRQTKAGLEYPVKIVANWPVEQEKEKDLVQNGSLSRIVTNDSQFPSMEQGSLAFDILGNIGENASGEFHITFEKGKGTLNGTFSAIVGLLQL
ncbi:MAG: hypothetical protein V1754_08965 [Pseudomonadota bacterium]